MEKEDGRNGGAAMIDLRNLTDYERTRYFTCDLPKWIYFTAAALLVTWLASPLIVGVIGIARGLF